MALRIKPNVDLKELEKFGFDLRASSQVGTYDWHDNFVDDNFGHIIGGENIYIYDRNDLECTKKDYLKIDIWGRPVECDLDTLYDLIKADLVVKVEDDK